MNVHPACAPRQVGAGELKEDKTGGKKMGAEKCPLTLKRRHKVWKRNDWQISRTMP
jgi:hypothetical protein